MINLDRNRKKLAQRLMGNLQKKKNSNTEIKKLIISKDFGK